MRELARLTHYNAGHVSNAKNGRARPSPQLAGDLDIALDAGGYLAALVADEREPVHSGAADDAGDVMAWISGSNTTDDAIEEMDRAASYLAEAHIRVAAAKILPEVLGVPGGSAGS